MRDSCIMRFSFFERLARYHLNVSFWGVKAVLAKTGEHISMEKNDIVKILIEDMSDEGLGIGHIREEQDAGMTVFVKDTAPGDEAEVRIVKLKKTYAYGRLEKLITPSPDRVEPVCPVARQCGGCTLQHISYESEVELKKKMVINCLQRIGGIEDPGQYLEGIYGLDVPERYRNKMQFPVSRRDNPEVYGSQKENYSVFSVKSKTVLGFYAGRTHSLIPIDDCVIGHEINRYIISAVTRWADKNHIRVYNEETGEGMLRHVLTRVGFKTGELMVCLVSASNRMPDLDKLVAELAREVDNYNKQLDKQQEKQQDKQLDKQPDKQLDKQQDKQLEKQQDKRLDKQQDKQLDKLQEKQLYNLYPVDSVIALKEVEEEPGKNKDLEKDNKFENNQALVKSRSFEKNGRIKLKSVVMNINREKTNRILGDKTILVNGQDYITDYIGDIKFQISAESFYQINPVQTEKIYNKVLEYADLKEDDIAWDMYCGIGTIALFLAGSAKRVYGVEVVPQAIEDAEKNASLNDITNTRFFTGKAEEVVPKWVNESGRKRRVRVVVVDPPRKGCDEKLLDTIAVIAPERLVYVSCDPATLARDVKILQEQGYELDRFAVYDQFSRSMHVETVCLLKRRG